MAAQLRFRHGTSYAALEQEITIGSQVLRVIQPTAAAAAGKNLPTTAQIAESLRALPAAQRAATHAIFVSPVRSARSRGINIVAAEGGAGQIIFFPLSGSQSQSMFDNRTMHEAGHNYQTVFWRSPAGPGEWDHAADLDGNSPSPYAATGAREDFCEFIIFYNTAKGTQCQFSAMQVYPHRWAKMDAYLLR